MTNETYIVETRKTRKTDMFGESTYFKMRKDRRYVLEFDDKVGHFIVTECDRKEKKND